MSFHEEKIPDFLENFESVKEKNDFGLPLLRTTAWTRARAQSLLRHHGPQNDWLDRDTVKGRRGQPGAIQFFWCLQRGSADDWIHQRGLERFGR